MSMKTGGGEDEPITDINVTPLVDVSLVLVIIFMVTTPFMTQSKLNVTLPKAMTDESKNEDHVTVTIDKDARISVNQNEIKNDDELLKYVTTDLMKTDQKVVIIKADEAVKEGVVSEAMDTIKKAKPKKIYFATQSKKGGVK